VDPPAPIQMILLSIGFFIIYQIQLMLS